MIAWMRVLTVTLTSKLLKKKIVFGNRWQNHEDDLDINIVGSKYMSSLKDACTIRIKNLTYSEVVQIIQGQYYDVEIKVGYRSKSKEGETIFKGGILYVSNSLDDRKSNTIIILCASNLVAKYGQSRINLSLNSGINVYSAINFICKRAGIPNSNVSTQFKKQFLEDVLNCNDTVGSWIDKLCSENSSYITNADSITDSTLSIYDANKSNARIIKLTNNVVDLCGGYPQLNSYGLQLTITPTVQLMCGDIIQIDNSIISIPVNSKDEATKNYGYYLDKDGQYMITQIDFNLQNRGSAFSITLTCKSRSLISNYLGTS